MELWMRYVSLFMVCFLCYGPTSFSRNNQFVFDDLVAVVGNTDVTDVKRPFLESIQKIFTNDFWGQDISDPTSHKSYRPLVTLTFHVDYRFFNEGNMPVNMKMVNLYLHCIICCILLHLLKRLFRSLNDSTLWMTTILFAIHPVHTEVVSGIVGRADLLCTLFYLLSIELYLDIVKGTKASSNRRIGLSGYHLTLKYCSFITSTTISLFCKEIGITVLPLCAILDIIKQSKHIQAIDNVRFSKHVIIRFSILILTSFSLLLLRLYIIDFQGPNFRPRENPIAAADSFFTRAMTQNLLYVINFWLMMCPDWLCVDWSGGSIDLITTWFDFRIIGIAKLYLLLFLILTRGTRNVYRALAFMIIPFIPASGIILVGFVIAERVLYIPSIGFCLLVCIGLENLYRKHPEWKKFLYKCFATLCLVYALKTQYRAHDWLNESNLFESALRVCPNNPKVYYNIARLHSYSENNEMAKRYYEEAIRIYPDYAEALMNLGNIYRAQSQFDTAEELITRSVNITEAFPVAWMNLGIVKMSKGKYNEALICYKKALRYRKNYALCYYNLGNLYLEMKKYPKALEAWNKSISIDPTQNRPWANYLTLLENEERTEEVLEVSERALKILPDDHLIIFLRAGALGKFDRFQEAEKLYLRVLEKQPKYALCYGNLGVLYYHWGKKKKAIESYRKALELDPTLTNVQQNLDSLLKKTKPKIQVETKTKT